jgi:DNA-binding MarR family transcriptional regulator/GNAT superfamily N-acetyltransferase
MGYLADLGEVALGSRLKALSDALYDTADAVYRARGSRMQARWLPILRLLHDRGPHSVSEVAREIGQTHSAVSQMAAKLKRSGWLTVVSDRKDKRRRVITLTARANAALREIKPVWKALREVVTERLEHAQVDLLPMLARFESGVLQPDLAEVIVARCKVRDQAALRIVPFKPELREHFYRLNADWLRRYFYLEEIDHRVLSQPETEILEPGGAILFAVLDDAVVGTCALKRDAVGVYELTKMAVSEQHQGLGIGRQLLEGAIAEFQRRKGKTLFLESNSKLIPAVRLYESLGFEHQATLKPDSHYQRSDVYMIWRDPAKARSKMRKRAA